MWNLKDHGNLEDTKKLVVFEELIVGINKKEKCARANRKMEICKSF